MRRARIAAAPATDSTPRPRTPAPPGMTLRAPSGRRLAAFACQPSEISFPSTPVNTLVRTPPPTASRSAASRGPAAALSAAERLVLRVGDPRRVRAASRTTQRPSTSRATSSAIRPMKPISSASGHVLPAGCSCRRGSPLKHDKSKCIGQDKRRLPVCSAATPRRAMSRATKPTASRCRSGRLECPARGPLLAGGLAICPELRRTRQASTRRW